jgi:FHA domain
MLRRAMGDTPQTKLISPRHLKAQIEAEGSGVPFLHWLDGDGEQHILMLTEDRGRVTVGRRAHCDVALTWDQEVSREHALLEPLGEDWTLVDDGLSRNGSYVNGDRITGRHRLSNRDRMCFGNTYVHFHALATAEGSESTARPQGATGQIPLSETQKKLLIALCRPIVEATSTTPATNPQIAAEVHMSIDRVKAQMRDLFSRFGLGELPQNEKRNRLVVIVLGSGLLAKHDF